MKIKVPKNLSKYIFVGFFSFSLIAFFTYFGVINFRKQPVIDEEVDVFDDEVKPYITFDNFEKNYILDNHNGETNFDLPNFKALFTRKLFDTKPKDEKFSLDFYVDNLTKIKKITVNYCLDNALINFWSYKLNNV